MWRRCLYLLAPPVCLSSFSCCSCCCCTVIPVPTKSCIQYCPRLVVETVLFPGTSFHALFEPGIGACVAFFPLRSIDVWKTVPSTFSNGATGPRYGVLFLGCCFVERFFFFVLLVHLGFFLLRHLCPLPRRQHRETQTNCCWLFYTTGVPTIYGCTPFQSTTNNPPAIHSFACNLWNKIKTVPSDATPPTKNGHTGSVQSVPMEPIPHRRTFLQTNHARF